MSLAIYNSLTRKKEQFIPLGKTITMYVCGPTVYDEPHIGHARSAFVFEVIRRYMEFRLREKGYQIRFVRNVTDVDDKIIDRAKKDFPELDINESVKLVSDKYLDSYHNALKALDIITPGLIEPRASLYIGQMIAFITELIKRESAYVSQGDVYFDITKARDYGKLSNQSLDKMEAGARVSPTEKKRNPLDFALWKSVKPDEPSWESPWGRGRPGWHIECSAMSSELLGNEFDVHGGGLDLIFPHHENEIAQSEGAGKKSAKYWIHHGLLTINGQKMAKSLKNFISVSDLLKKYPYPDVIKMFMLQSSYSSPLDFTWERLEEAKEAYGRIITFLGHAAVAAEGNPAEAGKKELDALYQRFIEAMDDDFNTPQALAAVFELVNSANRRITEPGFAAYASVLLKKMLALFTFTLEPGEKEDQDDPAIEQLIAQRLKARSARDFAAADSIRKQLEQAGIILEDLKDGTTSWRRKL